MFCFGGVLKLFGDLSGLVGPLSISYIVSYIELESLLSNSSQTYDNETLSKLTLKETYLGDMSSLDYPTWNDFLYNGWIIALMVLIFSITQGTLSQASTHFVNMEGIKLRNALQGLIYRKTMLLTSNCISTNTNSGGKNKPPDKNLLSRKSFSQDLFDDDKANNIGNITNLMSEDTFNVMSFFWIAHYVWAIPLKISVVIYLLYKQLGVSAIYGSVICIVTMTPMQFLIGKMMSNNMKKGTECTDERLKKINEVLIGIKLIKLNAWEKLFKEKITTLRNKELVYLDKDSVYWSMMSEFESFYNC